MHATAVQDVEYKLLWMLVHRIWSAVFHPDVVCR